MNYLILSLLSVIFPCLTRAGLIPLDNVNLLPYQFTYNYRYVFSDRVDEDVAAVTSLKNAYAKISLKVKMLMDSQSGEEYRMFVVLGEREYLQEMAIEMDYMRKSSGLKDAKDIESVINIFAAHLPLY